ncbi:MAG: glycosyltransferase [Candidatus Kaiserbacteria bacterium]|nr:glycosyltransferase [Candidatus Kaiserbacteria bacterium]
MERRKKILFLITKATWGGAQRYVYDLAAHLPRTMFQPAIAYGTEGRLAEMCRRSSILLLQLPSLGRDIAVFSDIKSFFEIRNALRSRPDILHLNSSKAAALGALAARFEKISHIVFTVHGWPFKEDRNIIARALIYLISWFTALLSHQVIVVSRADEDAGRRMWWVRKKIRYVPIGIEQPTFLSPESAYRAMFGDLTPPPISSETVRIVTIAELTKNKGLQYAIEAVALLKERGIDCIYAIVSPGEERERLERIARERGVADRVFFPGFIPNAAANLTGFDLFVLPSIKEGMPYVLLEADAAGLPIVTTEAVDAGLVERLACARRVPVKNALALADAIAEFGKKTKAAAGNRFSLTDMIDGTIEAYR